MTHQHHGHHRIGDKTLVDPVCGMKVAADPAKSVLHRGTTYYFCSTRCMKRFSADPRRYLEKEKPPGTGPGAIYTCPMHPEIRQVGPGNCPKCGMALEPVLASADERPNPELLDMTRRFWIGLVLTMPVFVLEMSGDVGLGLHRFMSASVSGWVRFLFSIPVVLGAAWPFFVRGWNSLVTGEPLPVEKNTGAKVTGGTINGTGSFVMRAERIGAETLLAQIVHMVAEAQRT